MATWTTCWAWMRSRQWQHYMLRCGVVTGNKSLNALTWVGSYESCDNSWISFWCPTKDLSLKLDANLSSLACMKSFQLATGSRQQQNWGRKKCVYQKSGNWVQKSWLWTTSKRLKFLQQSKLSTPRYPGTGNRFIIVETPSGLWTPRYFPICLRINAD